MGERALELSSVGRQNRHSGRVFVEFIVNKKGAVVNPCVIRTSGHLGLNAETLRIVFGLPRWKPVRLKGKKVVTSYVLPITFYLSE